MTSIRKALWDENPGLVQLLGLCPLLAVTSTFVNGLGLGVATIVVLTCSNILVSATRRWLRNEIRIPTYVLIIASLVTCMELLFEAFFPALDRSLGIFIPLIATNCAVLGVALLNVQQAKGFVESVFFGFGASMGFALVLVLFGAIRERLDASDVPLPFRGTAIALMTAGIMSLAFMGFSGMARL